MVMLLFYATIKTLCWSIDGAIYHTDKNNCKNISIAKTITGEIFNDFSSQLKC